MTLEAHIAPIQATSQEDARKDTSHTPLEERLAKLSPEKAQERMTHLRGMLAQAIALTEEVLSQEK